MSCWWVDESIEREFDASKIESARCGHRLSRTWRRYPIAKLHWDISELGCIINTNDDKNHDNRVKPTDACRNARWVAVTLLGLQHLNARSATHVRVLLTLRTKSLLF